MRRWCAWGKTAAVANIDTGGAAWHTLCMPAPRQTMNVSLPAAQDRFVRKQVASGRFRSASEVVREGLRLLEQAEHRRLLEKWLYEGLTPEEEKRIPPALMKKVKAHFRKLVQEARDEIKAGRFVDGPTAMQQLREGIGTRKRRSA